VWKLVGNFSLTSLLEAAKSTATTSTTKDFSLPNVLLLGAAVLRPYERKKERKNERMNE